MADEIYSNQTSIINDIFGILKQNILPINQFFLNLYLQFVLSLMIQSNI